MAIPLRQWHLKNFKSVEDQVVDFAPLTVLVGPNSSGKTSLLQSILLAVQATKSESAGDRLPLNGDLVSVGGFQDVVTAGKRGAVTFGGTFCFERPRPSPTRRRVYDPLNPEQYRWEASMRGAPPEDPGASIIRSISLEVLASSELDASLHSVARLKASRTPARRAWGEAQTFGSPTITPFRVSRVSARTPAYTDFEGSFRSLGRRATPIRGISLSGGVPLSFLVERDLHEILLDMWFEAVMRLATDPAALQSAGAQTVQQRFWADLEGTPPADIDDLALEAVRAITRAAKQLKSVPDDELALHRSEVMALFRESARKRRVGVSARGSVRRFMSEIGEQVTSALGPGRPVMVEVERETLLALEEAAAAVRGFLRNRVIHLGPLRQEPQVVYSPGASAAAGSLGTRGEYTAAVLHTLRDQVIDCPMPRGGSQSRRLGEAVAMWLLQLNVAEAVETGSLGRPGLELRIREVGASRMRDLTSVGVGISQLLPVVVACLMARPESLVLLEQPELHLHPALQQRLADFLVACSEADRQLIVETHSDHLVSRLRFTIADDPTDQLTERIAFLHAQKDSSDRTAFTRVVPNRFGGLEDWPPGFFDQAAEESKKILQAALAKRQRTTSSPIEQDQ
jgi:predicted ATPase